MDHRNPAPSGEPIRVTSLTGAAIDAVVLADIDLALERVERIEKTANEALRSYLGYINA